MEMTGRTITKLSEIENPTLADVVSKVHKMIDNLAVFWPSWVENPYL